MPKYPQIKSVALTAIADELRSDSWDGLMIVAESFSKIESLPDALNENIGVISKADSRVGKQAVLHYSPHVNGGM